MVSYKVTVFAENLMSWNVVDVIYITLVGENEKSDRAWFTGAKCYCFGRSTFSITCSKSIGELVLIEMGMKQLPLVPQHTCYINKVEVTSPEGQVYKFPVYHRLQNEEYNFREGTALRAVDEEYDYGKTSRKKDLELRKKKYSWHEHIKGLPHCMKSLPEGQQFSFTKKTEFIYNALKGQLEAKWKNLHNRTEPWKSFDEVTGVYKSHTTAVSDYVQKNWKEDAFFGEQFLNGVNPILIRRCSSLPDKFRVTEDMVFPEGGATLKKEIQNNNIYLCDYKLLDGVKTNTINGKKQYLMAPLVLFHKPDNKLKPIAIQLRQTPGKDNPIFLPTDEENDWLLAKIFVRSAAFNEHELNVHLLRTHLLAEVFAVSLLRNLPMVHPLYKLLKGNTRYTLHINKLARESLISPSGFFTLYTSSGGEGMITILQRSLSSLTYSSLCIPEDIKERDMESVPNYFYKDDGLKLWNIIHKFVEGVLTHYYKSDGEVQADPELQNYIKDIFEHGFLSKKETGIPQSFNTVNELVKFVTMVIFTCSAQHSAVNNGQFDYGAWMPNTPTTLQLPPPTKKGTVTEDTLLKTLPDVNVTANGLATLQLLSTQSTDFIPLGHYPQEQFTEEVPRKKIEEFKKDLEDLNKEIDKRNKTRDIPYTYLQPKNMENSVSL